MTTDPRIDDYIARAAPFAQPILIHLRKLAHEALPNGEEAIKWRVPTFMQGGKNIVSIAAFKAHCACVIHHEEQEAVGEGMGQLGKLATVDDLPPDEELVGRIRRGAERVAEGKRRQSKPKAEIPMPEDFATALENNLRAKQNFDSFTPAQRREYLEWITEAKRAETRTKRIATAVEWLAEGKRRNWKYENC
ncbi:YdeI/OmpD-associated family protein [Citromicrobium bathyomarinum]|uniref:YdeI/OmpD-associated family protein n=1 Tax=Citromicrobium bathyomarinum TaxID=72174 RepID=UPI003159B4A3